MGSDSNFPAEVTCMIDRTKVLLGWTKNTSKFWFYPNNASRKEIQTQGCIIFESVNQKSIEHTKNEK